MANTPFTDSELNLYCVVWFFFCFAQVCRHYLKGLQFSRQLSTARAQRDVPWTEGTLPQSMMASFSHHHGTIVRLGSSLM